MKLIKKLEKKIKNIPTNINWKLRYENIKKKYDELLDTDTNLLEIENQRRYNNMLKKQNEELKADNLRMINNKEIQKILKKEVEKDEQIQEG